MTIPSDKAGRPRKAHDDYKLWSPAPDPATIRPCPICGKRGEVWQYAKTPHHQLQRAVMCTNGEAFGPQIKDGGELFTGCILYMPPNSFYRPTTKEAVRYWNEYADALTAQRTAPLPELQHIVQVLPLPPQPETVTKATRAASILWGPLEQTGPNSWIQRGSSTGVTLPDPASTYDAVADAVQEIADAAEEAFKKAGLTDPGEWDSDNIVEDVKRGIVSAIERMTPRSTTGAWIPHHTNPERDGCLWPIAVRADGGGFHMKFEYYHFTDGWATDEDIAAWWNQPIAPIARALSANGALPK